MISSDFRTEARRKLSGKWGKAVCIVLAYMALTFVIGFIEGLFPESMEEIFGLVNTIINVPLSFGLVFAFLKLFNGEDVKAFDFATLGFSNFGKSWGVAFQMFLKMILPEIAVIVAFVVTMVGGVSMGFMAFSTQSSGASAFSMFMLLIGIILLVASIVWLITKSYYYQLAILVAIDNPDMSGADAVEESQRLMTGKRASLFCLELSFIGWAILGAIPFGIGLLWVLPYAHLAKIAFYKYALGNTDNVEVITSDNGTSENM